VPTIEVNVVPKEYTAKGRIVSDCSVPYLGIGVLREPIDCEVSGGFIETVSGGEQAEILKADWLSRNDKNVYNVAELGIGLNPNAIPTGVMLEDEGIIGTVHFGIGTSRTLGGDIQAPTHYDLLVWNPTIEADGEVIYDKTRFVESGPNA
jgi:2,5-dihydroxypyridine 5,6-dioxygenase